MKYLMVLGIILFSSHESVAQTVTACAANSFAGKWMFLKTNTHPGTEFEVGPTMTRCVVTVTATGATSGRCYDRYSDGETTGGITTPFYALTAGTLTRVTAINSCLYLFKATLAGTIKVSGDIVLAASRQGAHGYFWKDASYLEGGPFEAVRIP
jgi:hypothetical protein